MFNKSKLTLFILSAMITNANAMQKVYDEVSLQSAIAVANSDSSVHKIVFKKDALINLTSPVIYTGSQKLKLIGNGAIINGENAGEFTLDEDLTAVTEDATLIFNTAADLTFFNLTVEDSATRGIAINIPNDAEGQDIKVRLNKVKILNSALYGLHIDDNADDFDDGVSGSAIGIDLNIYNSDFIGNGTGAIDFDGIRVDERAEGDIEAVIIKTHIDGNGGDGIELDEAGDGNVEALMNRVSLDGNGFYNEEDLDDGFDIDEAGEGDVEVSLFSVSAIGNMDEGLDFDEAGEGDVELKLRHVNVDNNKDEGIKVDEEDQGDIKAKLKKVRINNSSDDGLQFTELGEGKIKAVFRKVTATNNSKYGIKMEQWVIEDEDVIAEEAGSLKIKNVVLEGNSKGDEIKTNNMIIK